MFPFFLHLDRQREVGVGLTLPGEEGSGLGKLEETKDLGIALLAVRDE